MESQKFFIILIVSLFSFSVVASGTTGNPYQNRIGGIPQPKTNPVYEKGKKLFAGRTKTYGKVKFCFRDAENKSEVKKVQRSTLKRYKGKKYNDLLATLYQCDNTERAIYQVLKKDDLIAYLYFLNARYKLKLK